MDATSTPASELTGFQKHWMPSWEAKKELGNCQVSIRQAGKYKSGRPRFVWTACGPTTGAYDERTTLAERDAMYLVSKRGKLYMVVSRYPLGVWGKDARDWAAPPPARENSAPHE